MFKHFRHYYWNKGKPYGIEEVKLLQLSQSYKIISDPYYKHISIEKYRNGLFEKVIYDSSLLDFRHLTLKDQMGWEREILKEEGNQTICLLRNQDDRAVFIETLTFEKNQCRTCVTSSIHGIPLSIHRLYYRHLHDTFNGVVLYDVEGLPVMMKIYETDPQSGDFTQLITEEWNIKNRSPLKGFC